MQEREVKPWIYGTFEILRKVGKVAYKLALLPQMQHIHNVFHISMLKKFNPNAKCVIGYERVELQPNLSQRTLEEFQNRVFELFGCWFINFLLYSFLFCEITLLVYVYLDYYFYLYISLMNADIVKYGARGGSCTSFYFDVDWLFRLVDLSGR